MTAQIFYLNRITPIWYNYIPKFTSFFIFNINYIISAVITTTATSLTTSSFFTYFWPFLTTLRYISHNFISQQEYTIPYVAPFLFPILKSGLFCSVFSLRYNTLGEQEQQQRKNREQQKYLPKVHPFLILIP